MKYLSQTVALVFFITASLFQSLPVFSQVDSSSTKENIKANLQTVDTTLPAVYKINFVPTIAIGAAATVANMIAINNVLHNKRNLTTQEIEALRPDIVNSFDRWALKLDPSKRDRFYSLSDKSLTIILAGSAATFLFNKKTKKDWLRLGLMYYQTQFLTFAFYDFSFLGLCFKTAYGLLFTTIIFLMN